MKFYIHECTDDTTLLFSSDGRVLGVYSDLDDAQVDFDGFPVPDDELEFETSPLDIDDIYIDSAA